MKQLFQFILWFILAKFGNGKNWIIVFFFMISGICQAQFSAGIGAGSSSKAPVVQLSLNYNTKLLGIDVGYISHVDNTNPAYFTGRLFKSLYVSETVKISPGFGAAYKMQGYIEPSQEGKQPENVKELFPLLGIELSKLIAENRAVIFGNLSYTDRTVFVTVGLRGILGGKSGCE